MKKIIQFHIYKDDQYYVAESFDLPVVTQGKTLDELADNIKEAVELHLEGEDLKALGLDQQPSILLNLELEAQRAYA